MNGARWSLKSLCLTLIPLLGVLFLAGCEPLAPFQGDDEKDMRYRVDVTVDASGGTVGLATTVSQEGDSPPPVEVVTAGRVYRIEADNDYSGNPWLLIVSATATSVPSGDWFSVTIEYTDLSYAEPQTTTVFEETYSGGSTDAEAIDVLESFPR